MFWEERNSSWHENNLYRDRILLIFRECLCWILSSFVWLSEGAYHHYEASYRPNKIKRVWQIYGTYVCTVTSWYVGVTNSILELSNVEGWADLSRALPLFIKGFLRVIRFIWTEYREIVLKKQAHLWYIDKRLASMLVIAYSVWGRLAYMWQRKERMFTRVIDILWPLVGRYYLALSLWYNAGVWLRSWTMTFSKRESQGWAAKCSLANLQLKKG